MHFLASLCALLGMCQQISAYCWQPGKNPSFSSGPKVEQIAIDEVRVSWYDLVKQIECVDQFLVKYWMKTAPMQAKLTDFVTPSQFEARIKVTPTVEYEYQAVAREDKGALVGVDYNRSPVVKFKTSRHQPNVDMTVPPSFEGRFDPNQVYEVTTEKEIRREWFKKHEISFVTPIMIGLTVIGVAGGITVIGLVVNYCKRVD